MAIEQLTTETEKEPLYCLCEHKGGVGKKTTVINLAHAIVPTGAEAEQRLPRACR